MHIAKYTRAAAGHMINHYIRAKDKKGNYVTINHQNIDPERTHLNYSLIKDKTSPIDHLRELLNRENIKCFNRADVKVICDVVLTAPKDMPEDELEDFFKVGFKELNKIYGVDVDGDGKIDNIISANVHMDEKTRQLHYCFCPLEKKQKFDKENNMVEFFKVYAKGVVSVTNLRQLHPRVSKAMKEHFGRDVGIENGIVAINGGNKTVKQLKNKKELEDEVERLSKVTESQNKTILSKKQEITQLNDKIADMTITDELHSALSEKQQTLNRATKDLQKLSNPTSAKEIDKIIRSWDCDIMPITDQYGNITSSDREIKRALNGLYDFLKNLIEAIKEFFSLLLGEDYQKEITRIKEDVENDEIEME